MHRLPILRWFGMSWCMTMSYYGSRFNDLVEKAKIPHKDYRML